MTAAAVQRAVAHARAGHTHPGLTLNLSRRVAVGDPQAPLEQFLEVLDARGLLDADGWLSPRVHLVSMGDHFDYGGAAEWRRAAEDGFALLSWLASHPVDQVTLLLGNHDSARVGELALLDDAGFANARAAAAAIYQGEKLPRDAAAEVEFLRAFPALPSSELAARDFAAFEVRQRELVTSLLRAGRFRLATSAGSRVLVTHAGVTQRELAILGVDGASAPKVEEALNRWLDAKVAAWRAGPLDLRPLHTHGDAQGEGGGLLYHRAALRPDDGGERRRRFPLHELPRGLTQVIGHVRDKKSLGLLGLDPSRARPGALRSLTVTDQGFEYRQAVVKGAHLLFLDGGMRECPPAEYQLLDLDALAAL